MRTWPSLRSRLPCFLILVWHQMVPRAAQDLFDSGEGGGAGVDVTCLYSLVVAITYLQGFGHLLLAEFASVALDLDVAAQSDQVGNVPFFLRCAHDL